MSKAKKFGLTGAGAGFCLALFMSAFAYYATSHHLAYDLSLLYLCLAPTSIVLIAGRPGNAISCCDDCSDICALERSYLWVCLSRNWEDLGSGFKINTR